MRSIALTKETSKGQVTRAAIKRALGSLLIALSGLLLYLDKVFSLLEIGEGLNSFGFSNYPTFIWVFTQSAAPMLMIIGVLLRPYIISFLIPVYCYTIQIVWVFQPNLYIDNVYLHLYAIGSCILFLGLMYLIKSISKWEKERQELKEEFKKEKSEIIQILRSKAQSEK